MSSAIAFTREVPSSITRCELTHLAREPIDLERARKEHAKLEEALQELGLEVHRLPEEPALPDSVFVEDTAVVLEELAVLTRPGAEPRRAELPSIERVLQGLRPIARLTPPATLDGGDVLVLDHDIVVGLTSRTNEMGASQLQDHLRPYGYAVRTVAVSQCLHLKSAVTRVGLDLLLVNPAWIERRHFDSWRLVESHPKEPFAANALWWGGNMVVHSEAHSRTRERLESAGVSVHPVPAAELAKGEGGVTCCALIVDGRAAPLARRNTPA